MVGGRKMLVRTAGIDFADAGEGLWGEPTVGGEFERDAGVGERNAIGVDNRDGEAGFEVFPFPVRTDHQVGSGDGDGFWKINPPANVLADPGAEQI